MVRLSVFYANSAETRFDFEYYLRRHIPLARQLLSDCGLLDASADRGIGGMGGAPAPFRCVTHLVFDSAGDVQKALASHGATLAQDTANFTNVPPQLQISDVINLAPPRGNGETLAIVRHVISNPKAFWSTARAGMANLPAGFTLHQVLPDSDGKQAFCLWNAPGIDALKQFIETSVGGFAANEYWQVDASNAVGVPR